MELRQPDNGIVSKAGRRPAYGIFAAGTFAPIFWLAIFSNPASAQAVSEFANDLNPLFQRMLASPSNLDNTSQYALGAAQGGDIESAIGTYEQLLFYNPTLSRVRFELGALYYRLGSYEMARGYFKTALQMRDISPELRENSEEFLADIEKKLQPDQFSGFAQTGLRYQTNPGAGPGQQLALASGQTFDSRFLARPDWNWFGSFGVNYSHDFEDQSGNTFEASLLGYDAQQFTEHQFDIGLLELRAGPRFNLSGISSGLSFKPYVVGTGGLLADAPYDIAGGGGATVHANLGSVAFDPFVEVVQQSYRNSSLYPLSSQLNGTLSTYAMQVAAPIDGNLGWQTRVAYAHDSTVYGPYGYDEFSGDLWLPWNVSMPWGGRKWTFTPTGGVSYWQYKAPDPTIDPTTTERNLEWRVGLGIDVPIRGQLYLDLLVQYQDIQSNIPIFAMQNFSVSAGPSLKF